MRIHSAVVLLAEFLLLIVQWADAATATKQHNIIHEEIGHARNYDAVQVLLKKYYKKAARRFGISSDYDPSAINDAAQNVFFDDGTEMSRNRKVLGELFENDIVLTVEQAQTLLDTFEDDNRRVKRNEFPDPNAYWRNITAVPYAFKYATEKWNFVNGAWTKLTEGPDAPEDVEDWKATIRSGLAHIESETCIRFAENGPGADSILFIRGSGCYSSVGRIGGVQQVSIGNGCGLLGIVAHEVTHALGFWHEQSRRDREDNIYVNFANIFAGTQGNFEIRSANSIDNMGQPYDLGSVMHYGSKAFSIRYDLYTIQTRDPKYQTTLGQRVGLAFIDAKQLNIRYCSKVCPVSLNCRYGGYTNPNNCNQCKCPDGFGGTYCTSVAPSDSNCGGELIATYDWQEISNPNQVMVPNQNCNWRIRAPQTAQRVLYEVITIDTGCQDACTSYLEIKSTSDFTPAGFRVCCKSPSTLLVSDTNEMLLLFRSDPAAFRGYKGFRLRYVIDGDAPPPIPSSTTPTTTPAATTVAATKVAATKVTATRREKTTTRTTKIAKTTTDQLVTPYPTGSWGAWSSWGGCSLSCGGCGISRRVRTCYHGNLWCSGSPEQSKPCNQEACPSKKRLCYGRLVATCDLISKITFVITTSGQSLLDPSAVAGIPGVQLIFDDETSQDIAQWQKTKLNKKFARVRRRRSTCIRKFSYKCTAPGRTLSVSWVDQKSLRDNYQSVNTCCSGYRESGGLCVRQ